MLVSPLGDGGVHGLSVPELGVIGSFGVGGFHAKAQRGKGAEGFSLERKLGSTQRHGERRGEIGSQKGSLCSSV